VAYQIHETRLRCIQEALQRSHDYARLGSDRFEGIIAEARSVLEVVSKVPDVTSGTEAACQQFLSSIGHAHRWTSAIWVIGDNGRVRCSTVANSTGLELSDREAYRAAVGANAFSIHDFFVRKLTKLPLAVASLSARDQITGEPVLLAAALNLSWFDKLAAEVGERAGADILLVDSKGTLLSRFPKETAVIGDSISRNETIRDILNASEGQLALVDGKPSFIGYATLSGTSLRLIVGFERSQILADVNRGTIQAISIFGTVLLFAARLIWSAGNRIFANPPRELDELLQVTLDNLDQGLIVDDKHGTIPICNRRAIELLGLPEELMKSRPKVEPVIEFQKRRGELAGSRPDIKDHLQSGGSDEKNIYEQERPNGTTLEIRVVSLPGGGVVRTYTDVSARKRAEAERDRTRQLLELVVENVPSTIAVKDARDFRYLLINRAGETYYGIPRKDMMGRTVHDCLPKASAELVTKLDEQTITSPAKRIVDEHFIEMPDGRKRIGMSSRTCLLADNGEPAYLLVVVDDITECKALQSELVAAKQRAEEEIRAKGQFLATMTHEIRTPLSSIIGYTDLMLDSEEMGATQRRHVHLIQDAGTALLTVVNDILDLSKIEAGQIELREITFAPKSFAENSVQIVRQHADAKQLWLTLDVDPRVPEWLVGDEDRLRQVLLNLVNNAVKFTRVGGITVRLRHEDTSEGGSRVRLEVEDTGIGIAENKLHRLFRPFMQADGSISREFGGTGLGLSISKKLIELMGGSIGVMSKAGDGSTFWFEVTLKRAQPNKEPTMGPGRNALENPRMGNILVVDDVEANLEITSEMLRQGGYNVDTVRDGATAIEIVRSKHYDLILMDVQMSGMDGLTTTRVIRELQKIPIVAMTANVYTDEIAVFLAAGMNDHIAKPFRAPQLLAVVEKWMLSDASDLELH
jgi:PAS domain S-box-containing protein